MWAGGVYPLATPALGGAPPGPRPPPARRVADPEVLAKPTRRRFSAEYRLRIVEEADRGREPGEIGRLLRREGRYSSHLSTWRKAPPPGGAAGPDAAQARSQAGAVPTPRRPSSPARGSGGAAGEGAGHGPYAILEVQGNVAGLLGFRLRDGKDCGWPPPSLARPVGMAPAGRALGVSRAPFDRRRRPAPGHPQPRTTPARALSEEEQEQVLDRLASPRFVDRSPAEVVATRLDEGRYLGSERTRYRILSARQPVRERRNPRTHPRYAKPELVARAPNPVWSWDLTRLLGPKTGSSFYLYVLLDLFRRYGVGWRVAEREGAALASRRIEESCLKQGIQPRVRTLHFDRGAPMTSPCTAQLLAQLGITRSLRRPRVRDDHPFSEAPFQTLKYHPGFPGRFPDRTAALAFGRSFFPWYHTQQHPAGLAMLTPDEVHHGRARQRIEPRRRTLGRAWGRHPERFVRGKPKPQALPETVGIHPPKAIPTVGDAQYRTTLAVSTALTGSARSSTAASSNAASKSSLRPRR